MSVITVVFWGCGIDFFIQTEDKSGEAVPENLQIAAYFAYFVVKCILLNYRFRVNCIIIHCGRIFVDA